MKHFFYLLLFIGSSAFAQPTCPNYSSVGDASSPYITSSDPDCAICPGGGDTGPWSGTLCTGTIVSTAFAPTLSLTLAYTAVNTDDYATISIDGGGVMTLTGVNVGVVGDVIGPYLCAGSYGDVFLTVESTLPFTTVTLTNTGCSSGWVISCPGGIADAGVDDLTTFLCSGIFTVSDLLSADAEPGGVWTETTGSGGFDPITTDFDTDGLGAGIYSFIYVVEGCGGETDTAFFDIELGEGVTAGEDGAAELCAAPGTTIDLNTLLDGSDLGGVWSETTASGAFNPVTGIFDASGLPAGDYTFTHTIVGIPPCTDDVADFTITVHPLPNVTITSTPSPAKLCAGEAITLTASAGGPGETTVWDPFVINGVAFVPPIGIETYDVELTSEFGCLGTESIEVEVNPSPVVLFEADTLSGCNPLQVTFTNLTVLAGSSCIWNFGDGSSGAGCGSVIHTYNTAGDFDVDLTVETTDGCSALAIFNDYISIKKQPKADFDFTPRPPNIENTLVEFANYSDFATAYDWSFGDGSAISNDFNPSHIFPDVPNTTYRVSLIAKNDIGCADTVIKNVFVEDVIIFYVPNTFTPDGDSFNEEFKPVMTSGYDVYDYHLTIFNRWGERVFESFDAAYGWNGTYGDRGVVTDGVYVWQIEFGDTRSDKILKYQGHVTILR
ncbi:PKD domain-containing protein [Crocinitomix sp.]|nr:PKD domain-containing protein [Crocinitomix sp.]